MALNRDHSQCLDDLFIQQRVEAACFTAARKDIKWGIVPHAVAFISQPERNPYRAVHRDRAAGDVQGPGFEVSDVVTDAIRGNKARFCIRYHAYSRPGVTDAEHKRGLTQGRAPCAERDIMVYVFGIALVVGDRRCIVRVCIVSIGTG